MILVDLSILLKYLREFQQDMLFVALSDHGGDESPFSQERYNHNTPFSKDDNEAFLLIFNDKVDPKKYSKKDLRSDQISEIISSFLLNVNSIGEFNANFDFYLD